MSIELAEQLKSQLTDKHVVVDPSVAELKRFAGFTGTVKTVNMNGQALVQFDSPEDISWYDIHPQFLTVVDAPQPKEKAAPAKSAASQKPATAKKPAAKPAAGMSPLEQARAQGAVKAGGATPNQVEKPAAAKSTKGLSPLELARMQGAVGSQPSAATPTAADSEKKLSPLELARQQDGGGQAKAPAADTPRVEQSKPESAPSPRQPEPAAEKPAAVVSSGEALSIDEILALARQQGPFKG
jgi:hypothetical protein